MDGNGGAAGLSGLPGSNGDAGRAGPNTGYDVATNPVALAPTSLPTASVNAPYSQTLTATGGFGGPYTFSVLAGSLPPGLTLRNDGLLSGIPSSADGSPYTFTLAATDGNGLVATQTYSLVVNSAPGLTPGTLPTALVGVTYSQTLTASGGSGTGYAFAVTAGSLPAWLTLDASTGRLSGTPPASARGTQAVFTVTVTDSLGASRSQPYFLNVGTFAISPDLLPALVVGDAYRETFTASGGSGSYTYTLAAGTLPTGLSLTSGGVLSGKPTAAGWFQFTVAATDSAGDVGTQSFALYVPTVALASSLPPAVAGSPYRETLTGENGAGPYTYSVSSGSLPSWLTFNTSTGQLSGTPPAAGSASFTITATDSQGAKGSQAYTLTVEPAVTVGPPSLPGATAGSWYDQVLGAAGGSGTGYTYSITAGSLPGGLTLSGGGELSGTPTAPTSSPVSFTVTAADSNGTTGSQTFSLAVRPPLTLGPPALPGAMVGTAFEAFVTAAGGSGGYTYTVTAGALPSGLGLNGASGEISGTPTASGSFPFVVTATDQAGDSLTRGYTLAVNPVPAAPAPPPGPVAAVLIPLVFGSKRHHTTRLAVLVFFSGGLPPLEFLAPYQPPTYHAVEVVPLGFNADGTFSDLLFTARKGRRQVSTVVPV